MKYAEDQVGQAAELTVTLMHTLCCMTPGTITG